MLLYPTPYGALTQLYAGTMPEALRYNGEVCSLSPIIHDHSVLTAFLQFLIPWARLGQCRPEMYDEEVGDRLWKWLQDETSSSG